MKQKIIEKLKKLYFYKLESDYGMTFLVNCEYNKKETQYLYVDDVFDVINEVFDETETKN